jgi:hypothetical protein
MIEDDFSGGSVLLPLVDTMEGLLEPLCLSKSLSVSVFGCRPAGESVSFAPEGDGVCPSDLEHINAGPSPLKIKTRPSLESIYPAFKKCFPAVLGVLAVDGFK